MIAKLIKAFTGHEGSIYALEGSGRKDRVFTAGGDRIVSEWDLSGNEPARGVVKVEAVVYALCHIPERNWLLVGTSEGRMHVIDLKGRKELHNLELHKAGIFDLRFHPTTGNIFSASGDGSIAVLQLDRLDRTERRSLAPGHKIRAIDFHPLHPEVAFACGDGNIRIYSLERFEERLVFPAHALSANCVRYHPAGNYLLSGGRDAHLCAWDPATGASLERIPAHNYAIYSIAFSPDQHNFATASRDKTIKIWDAETIGFRLRIDRDTYNGHRNSVNKVLWSRYDNYLISAGDDKAVLVWEVV